MNCFIFENTADEKYFIKINSSVKLDIHVENEGAFTGHISRCPCWGIHAIRNKELPKWVSETSRETRSAENGRN